MIAWMAKMLCRFLQKKIDPQSTFPYQIRYEFTKQVCKEKKIQHREYTKGSKGNDPWTCWAIWAKIQAHATFAFLLFLFYYREQTLFFKKKLNPGLAFLTRVYPPPNPYPHQAIGERPFSY